METPNIVVCFLDPPLWIHVNRADLAVGPSQEVAMTSNEYIKTSGFPWGYIQMDGLWDDDWGVPP